MLSLSAVRIPLKGLKVTARQQLAGQDMSGSSAATDQAETGDKAKVLAVTGSLPYDDALILNRLYTLAGAKQAGARMIYRIDNLTANALKVSQVKFQGTISAQEDASLRQWLVSFELVEYMSVAERADNQEQPKPATQQKAEGVVTPSNPSSEALDTPSDSEVEMTGVMKYLALIDKVLA